MPPSVLNHRFQVEHIEERLYYPQFCLLCPLEPLNWSLGLRSKRGRHAGRLCERLLNVELNFMDTVLFLLSLSTNFLEKVPMGFPVALILVFLVRLSPAFLVELSLFLVVLCMRNVLSQVCKLLFELLISQGTLLEELAL